MCKLLHIEAMTMTDMIRRINSPGCLLLCCDPVPHHCSQGRGVRLLPGRKGPCPALDATDRLFDHCNALEETMLHLPQDRASQAMYYCKTVIPP